MIPEGFDLVNRRWRVNYVTTKELRKEFREHPSVPKGESKGAAQTMGWCDNARAIIFINTDLHACRSEMEHTFWHELVHAVLYADGKTGHNEEFVDRIGGFIHQIVQTIKSPD